MSLRPNQLRRIRHSGLGKPWTWGIVVLVSALVFFGVVLTHETSSETIVLALVHAAGMAGIAVAVIAMIDSKTILRSVSDIVESVSTKYIGKFPANMGAVVELVKSSTKSLTIVCDHAGYGQFSDPQNCAEYDKLLRLKPGEQVRVTMSVYDLEKFSEIAKSQLDRMTNDFPAFTTSDSFKRFAQFHHGLAQKMQESPAAFLHHMRVNEAQFRDLFAPSGIALFSTKEHMPIYMWVADDSRAIFCIVVRAASSDLEYAFETRDGNLIRGLLAMSATYTQPVPGENPPGV